MHEKSLLLALLPASFFVDRDFLLVSWFQVLGVWTMFPLLAKDGLRLPYAACIGLYLVCNAAFAHAVSARGEGREKLVSLSPERLSLTLKRAFVWLSAGGMVTLHVCELVLAPPQRYPDIYPAVFSIFGAANLCVAYVYFTAWLYRA